jgi:hypothetical protein
MKVVTLASLLPGVVVTGVSSAAAAATTAAAAVVVCFYHRTRPVYVQSTWLKSRAVMHKYPMRYGFVTDLLEEVSL